MKIYPNVQVTKGLAGWFAVKMWWNPDFGGFPEPWITGVGRYLLQIEAVTEGKAWAETEGIPFYPPDEMVHAALMWKT